MFLTLVREKQRCCFSVCCKGLEENSKELLLSTISREASFDDDSNKETFNVNKVCQQR